MGRRPRSKCLYSPAPGVRCSKFAVRQGYCKKHAAQLRSQAAVALYEAEQERLRREQLELELAEYELGGW